MIRLPTDDSRIVASDNLRTIVPRGNGIAGPVAVLAERHATAVLCAVFSQALTPGEHLDKLGSWK